MIAESTLAQQYMILDHRECTADRLDLLSMYVELYSVR
jgi:hypothetical protein